MYFVQQEDMSVTGFLLCQILKGVFTNLGEPKLHDFTSTCLKMLCKNLPSLHKVFLRGVEW